ncbi:MAG: hypothetical protein ACFFHD_00110 [Promethearchaeota archaeon]
MKIIGLLVAWSVEDWIEYSIQQALNLVDELIISVGPFHKHLQNTEDQTLAIVKKYIENEKIKFLRSICLSNNTIDQNRCMTLNQMLKFSNLIQEGNLIWLLDAFDFYSSEAIVEIKKFIKECYDFDEIQLITYNFCINFNYYVKSFPIKIFKIKDQKPKFISPMMLSYKTLKTYVLLRNNPMFNYSLLTGEQIKGISWILEGKYKHFLWIRKIFNKYDPNNEEFWMEKNKELFGKKRFFYPTLDIVENFGYGLMIYKGKHPDIIENSEIKKILDFREYIKQKQNYQRYLKTVKTIIIEINKSNKKRVIFIFLSQVKKLINIIHLKIYPYLTKRIKNRIKILIKNILIIKIINNRFQFFKNLR